MGSAEIAESPPPDRRRERIRGLARLVGELCITFGIVILLFVFYEVYVTDWSSSRKQADASERLRQEWVRPDPVGADPVAEPVDGRGFARLHIPVFGPNYRFTVLEGTDQTTLASGPGHYTGTALPGERGNLAIAGHRIGKGAPFRDLDRLRACDALIVETASDWYVYRVLPMQEEVAGWNGHGGDPRCQRVSPIGGPYASTVGARVVRPDQGEVIFPVPGVRERSVPRDRQTRLITLTTCHPWFSAEQRLIVQGVLTKRYPKAPGHPDLRPSELEER